MGNTRNGKILIFDNNSETLDKLVMFLQGLNIVLEIRPTTDLPTGNFAGVVISGGALPYEHYKEILNFYKSYLESIEIPVLGVCLGMRILCYCYGARFRRMPEIEKGIVKVQFHRDYPLALGHKHLVVQEDHIYESIHLPSCLVNYGSSAKCRIQAVKHRSKLQFGVQFHPEIDGKSDGYIILKNFINLCFKKDVNS